MNDKSLLSAQISGIDLVRDYVAKYGERGKAVLMSAVEAMLENEKESHRNRLGDFDYRTMKIVLTRRKVSLKPHVYLRVLEREYGIITQTYRSSKQEWWAFTDRNIVLKWYNEEREREIVDPEMKTLISKYKFLKIDETLRKFENYASKSELTVLEEEEVRRYVFSYLDAVVSLLKEMKKYGEVFEKESSSLQRLVDVIYELANKI